jgi:hypothetical protein
MNALIPSLLAALLLVGTTGRLAEAPAPSTTGEPGDPVYVGSTEIRSLGSDPVQVLLIVRGDLPTPCHEAVFEVQDLGASVDVRLWSLAGADAFCVQVLEPFELVIPLGSFETADLPVVLNGEEVGRIEVGPDLGGPSLVAAGWSFGHCVGYCVADLVIDGDDVSLTGSDPAGEPVLFSNRGSLTPEGRTRLAEALATLGSSSLDPVYGCPDCADGGALYLDLARDGVVEHVVMEFQDPPDPLAELHAVAMSMSVSLETCVPSELVQPADTCLPYVRS